MSLRKKCVNILFLHFFVIVLTMTYEEPPNLVLNVQCILFHKYKYIIMLKLSMKLAIINAK